MNLPTLGWPTGRSTLTLDALSTNELLPALAELFTVARQAVARRLESVGVPFVVPAERPVVERGGQGAGSWRTDTVNQARNVLGVGLAARRAAPWLTAAEIAQARDCALKLAAVSTTLPFGAPLGANEWELVEEMVDGPSKRADSPEDLADWVLWHIVLPAMRWHLEALPSVGFEDHRRAVAFANEVLQVAQDDHLWFECFRRSAGLISRPPIV